MALLLTLKATVPELMRSSLSYYTTEQAITQCVAAAGESPPYTNELVAAAAESALLPCIRQYLRNDSLIDLGHRTALFLPLLALVQRISASEFLAPLIDSAPRRRRTGDDR
jgi:hypothetical protein